LWEGFYKQPSIGNPLFEDISLAQHLQHLMAKHLHRGGGVVRTEDGYRFTEKAVVDDDELRTDVCYPEYVGDHELDTIERRVALGLPPDPEDDDG
jgi:hypothetical protein